jgi:glycosyltransferase involved in cell wall biosynthesis
MNDTPLISVITPVYNGADYLSDLIESVIAQDYPHFEHIVIDDGSTDDGATLAVLQHYEQLNPQLRWRSRHNKGQYATQNEAIEEARGDIIVVIAADDCIADAHVFGQVADYWREHPEVEFLYGRTRYMDQQGKLFPNIEITWRPSRWLIRQVVYAQHCSTYVSRQFLIDNRLFFDASFKYTGDWDWLIRLFNAAQSIGYIKQPLAIVRMHNKQTSRNVDVIAASEERRRICQSYNGNYRLHRLITRLNNYRSMTLMGLQILRTDGVKAFSTRVSQWLGKRLRLRS